MNPSDAAKLSRLSREKLEAEIEKYTADYRPKVIRTEIRDCYPVPVKIIQAAYAEGYQRSSWIKSTVRNGNYEV